MLFVLKLCAALFTLSNSGYCVEVGVPERFLRPRNFNPHPYVGEEGEEEPQQLLQQLADLPHPYRLFERPPSRGDLTNNGPVQFPKVPDAAQIQMPTRSQSTSRLKPSTIKHPLNTGVYNTASTISPLQDFQVLELVPSTVHTSDADIYSARLARPSSNSAGLTSSGVKPKNYAFSYAVKDGHSGDDFSHRQAQAGAKTMGEYRVRLPDGRTQVVSYTADHHGYRADVRYDEENLVEPAFTDYKPVYKPTYKSSYKPTTVFVPVPRYTGNKQIITGNTGSDYTPIHEEDSEDNINAVTARPRASIPAAAQTFSIQSTPSSIDYYNSPTIGKTAYYIGTTVSGQQYFVSSTPAPQISQQYYPSSTVPPQYHGPTSSTPSEHRYFLVN